MRVGTINNTINFGKGINMVIPTDINKITESGKNKIESSAFLGLNIKPVAVPICDSFVYVFK